VANQAPTVQTWLCTCVQSRSRTLTAFSNQADAVRNNTGWCEPAHTLPALIGRS
jgi:hypothetical protein